ncbi:expressed protein, partial [Phakopsora pachyrhizi]
ALPSIDEIQKPSVVSHGDVLLGEENGHSSQKIACSLAAGSPPISTPSKSNNFFIHAYASHKFSSPQNPQLSNECASGAAGENLLYQQRFQPIINLAGFQSTQLQETDRAQIPNIKSFDTRDLTKTLFSPLTNTSIFSNGGKNSTKENLLHNNLVPAANVFCRGAPPLLLPALNEVLERCETPIFTESHKIQMSPEEWTTWKKNIRKESRLSGNKSLRALDKENNTQSTSFLYGAETVGTNCSESPHMSSKTKSEKDYLDAQNLMPISLITPQNLKKIGVKESVPDASVALISLISKFEDKLQKACKWETFNFLSSVKIFCTAFQLVTLPLGIRGSPTKGSVSSNIRIFSTRASSFFEKVAWVWFGKISAVAGFDLLSFSGYSNWWFWILASFIIIIFYEFFTITRRILDPRSLNNKPLERREGLEAYQVETSKRPWKNRKQSNFYFDFVVTLLSVFYVPFTKLSISALIWSSEFWIVENPYAETDSPQSTSSGSSTDFQDSLNFCYTTTAKAHADGIPALNGVIFILPLALLLFLTLTFWFPLQLWRIVIFKTSGDDSSFGGEKYFTKKKLYLEGRDKPWLRFELYTLITKAISTILVTFLSKDNCIFRKFPRGTIDISRQVITTIFFVAVYSLKMMNKTIPHSNYSSLQNFNIAALLLISVFGFLICLGPVRPGAAASALFFIISLMIYAVNLHFIFISTEKFRGFYMRMRRQIEIRGDLFSPEFNLCKDVKQRIWQEGICTIFFGLPIFGLDGIKTLEWSSENNEVPYLIEFNGTVAERMIENIKLLQYMGEEGFIGALTESLELRKSPTYEELINKIKNELTGPDCFWKPPQDPPSGVKTFFGRAIAIPFPFRVVFFYDQNPKAVFISNIEELRLYVSQNNAREVLSRKQIRIMLRSLEGKKIFTPVSLHWNVVKGKNQLLKWLKPSYSNVEFRSGILKIQRNFLSQWKGYNYNSGFEVFIDYCDGVARKKDGSTKSQINYTRGPKSLGIRQDFDITPTLAKIFFDNRHIIDEKMNIVQYALNTHREHFAAEFDKKLFTMSPHFMNVFFAQNNEKSPISELKEHVKTEEANSQLQQFPEICRGSLKILDERMDAVNRNRCTQIWYLIFDDIYRRNIKHVRDIASRPEDFSPHYRSSICYTPWPRWKLENFLISKNLASQDGKSGYFHSGVLNQIYFVLDQVIFQERDFCYNQFHSPQIQSFLKAETEPYSTSVIENFQNTINQRNNQFIPRSILHAGIYNEIDKEISVGLILKKIKKRFLEWLRLEGKKEQLKSDKKLYLLLGASSNSFNWLESRIKKNKNREFDQIESKQKLRFKLNSDKSESICSSSTVYGFV